MIAQAIEQVCTEYAGNLNGMEPPTVEAFRAGRLFYAYVPGLNDDLQALISPRCGRAARLTLPPAGGYRPALPNLSERLT